MNDPLIQKLEHDLPDYLADRRWYRAKALTISALTIQDIIHADSFLILLVNVQYAQGGEDLYLLPVTSVTTITSEFGEPITTFESPDGKLVYLYDAIQSRFFRTALFRALISGTSFQGRVGALTAHSQAGTQNLDDNIQSSVSKAEQSNTSIIYNREFILKLFRKIEPGINPDIEIGAFLTAQNFKHTPAVVGTFEYQAHNGETFSAGILQHFVPNQGDAWKYTLDALSTYYSQALNSTLDNPQLLGNYTASAILLGVRTAQMHIALSSSSTNPDFTPELFTGADGRALSDEIAAQADTSFNLLRDNAASLPYTEQQLAFRVLELQSRVIQSVTILSELSTDAKRIRHHGDYHLGQVLYTGSDFMIIDFEGEPARSLSERRTKALGLRDVAGMLRSFQYAAYAGLYGLVPGLPTDPESSEKIAACSAYWNSQVSRLYLDAYFAEADGRLFVPATSEQRSLFLKTYLLQKALYEVQYELNNRPAWVGIPLRGILSLIDDLRD